MTSAERLVRVWEAGIELPQPARAVEILAAADPETSRSDIAALSLGERDRRLLCLRRTLFGPMLEATVGCPQCGGLVEFAADIASLLVPERPVPERTVVSIERMTVEFRLPTSADLLALARSPAGVTERGLLARCVTRVVSDGEPPQEPAIELSEAVRDAVVSTMAELDPQADVQLSLSCPICEHEWCSDFDIVSYVWTELCSWVRRLLVDVHRLALAYGWPESEILGMSSQRRTVYLELIGA